MLLTGVSETNIANDAIAYRVHLLDSVQEVNSAWIVEPLSVYTLGSVTEIDSAEDAIGSTFVPLPIEVMLTGVSEVDSANSPLTVKSGLLSGVSELESGNTVSTVKYYMLGSSNEIDRAKSNYPQPFKKFYGEFEVKLASPFKISLVSRDIHD